MTMAIQELRIKEGKWAATEPAEKKLDHKIITDKQTECPLVEVPQPKGCGN